MNEPLVSFCIPSYNRSRYLRSLLDTLVHQLAGFPHPYEIVISDNASPDDTQAVIDAYAGDLPIRKFRQSCNVGGAANWHFAISQARGEFIVSLADDDTILGPQTADAIARLRSVPEAGASFAPWLLFDVPTDRVHCQFYSHPADFVVARGDYIGLLDRVLTHRIWPEIGIVRRKLLNAIMPRVPESAFYAFVHAGEYLSRNAVLFQSEPFYVSVMRHFVGDERSQTGSQEAEHAWDRYRGGLEYLLARGRQQLADGHWSDYMARIASFIGERMAVAVRLRMHKRANPVETFYLATRAVALGAAAALPAPLQQLRSYAALHFLTEDVELNRGRQQLVCVGHVEPEVRAVLNQSRPGRVRFDATPGEVKALKDAVVLLCGSGESTSWVEEHAQALAEANVQVVEQGDLMAKFGC